MISDRFTIEEVNLVWDIIAIELSGEINLIEFRLLNINTYNETDIRHTGNFSILVAEFIVARNSRYVITTTIIPSSILILVSYTVFWLKTLGNVKSNYLELLFSPSFNVFLFHSYSITNFPMHVFFCWIILPPHYI